MMQRKISTGLRAVGVAGVLFAGACVLSCGVAKAQSQATAYIRIVTPRGPVAGAATDPSHEGWIPCREASMPSVSEITASNKAMEPSSRAMKGVSPEPRDAATGMASGKRRWAPLRITKEVDSSSPRLFELAKAGENIPEVDVELIHNEGGRMVPAAKYKLTNAMVTAVQRMGGGERPTESVTIAFQKIELVH